MIYTLKDQNKKYSTEKSVVEIIETMMLQRDQLVEVDFTGNVFTPEAFKPICEAMSSLELLKSVTIERVFSTLDKDSMHKNLIMISKALINHKIQKIDISDNAISCNFPKEFEEFIANAEDLMVLRAANCGLGKDGCNQLAGAMEKIKNKNSLEVLDLAQNRFFTFPEKLMKVLPSFIKLRELRLQYNTIGKESMDEFLKLFSEHSLEVFDIRDNFLSLEGCRILGNLFNKWNIREMRISDCLMRNDGVKSFLKAANTKPVSESLPGEFHDELNDVLLDISNNEFEQDAIPLLVEFANKNSIKTLMIYGNDFDDASGLAETVRGRGGNVVLDEIQADSSMIMSLNEKIANL